MSWKRFKFGNQKLYIIPGTAHRFRTEHDAKFYCNEHDIDFATVEKYDSKKEYDRWLELQMLEKTGEIVNLRRQVEYELIPAHYEMIFVKEKTVKQWLVYTEDSLGKTFDTKKEAIEYCKSAGLKQKDIGCIFNSKHNENISFNYCWRIVLLNILRADRRRPPFNLLRVDNVVPCSTVHLQPHRQDS